MKSVGTCKVQILHVVAPTEQSLDGGSASSTGMAKFVLLSAMFQEFEDRTTLVFRMHGRLLNMGFDCCLGCRSVTASGELDPPHTPSLIGSRSCLVTELM